MLCSQLQQRKKLFSLLVPAVVLHRDFWKLAALLKFNETLTHFWHREHMAEVRGRPDSRKTLMLQHVVTGKAQSTFSALSSAQSGDYVKVNAAVLKAHEPAPKTYRQEFGNFVSFHITMLCFQYLRSIRRPPVSRSVRHLLFNRWN